MNSFSASYLSTFWSLPVMEVNLLVFLNLAGGLPACAPTALSAWPLPH